MKWIFDGRCWYSSRPSDGWTIPENIINITERNCRIGRIFMKEKLP